MNLLVLLPCITQWTWCQENESWEKQVVSCTELLPEVKSDVYIVSDHGSMPMDKFIERQE